MNPRQKEVFKIIIEKYIETAKPVSSQEITQILSSTIVVASSTVRNDCLMLEKLQYLTKSHGHSGGRIPTTSGYRYYLDKCVPQQDFDQSLQQAKVRLKKLFKSRELSINNILNESGKMISHLTNVTSVIVNGNIADAKLKLLKLIPLNRDEAVILFILNTGEIRNKKMTLNQYDMQELALSIQYFNQNLTDLPLSVIPERINLIKPILKQQISHYELILKEFLETMINMTKLNYQTYGIHNMLQNPEFQDAQKIIEIINFIETVSPFVYYKKISEMKPRAGPKKDKTNTIALDQFHNVSIKIGDEITANKDDKDVAMLMSTYSPQSSSGANGLIFIGPKRMEYSKITKLLTWINQEINKKYYAKKKKDLDQSRVTPSKPLKLETQQINHNKTS